MFWLALAPLWSALQPIDYGKWWESVAFPGWLMEDGRQTRTVRLRVIVTPEGKPRNCELEKSSGIKRVDEYTCAVALMKGKYLPARWVDGSPAVGVDRTPVSWTLKRSGPRHVVADVQLAVNKLPTGITSPTTVAVAIAADERGRVVACAAAPKRFSSLADPRPELVTVACEQMMQYFTAKPPLGDHGEPVHSVQNASVEFVIRK